MVWSMVLNHQFPILFSLDRIQQAFIAESSRLMDESIMWDYRDLMDNEVSDLTSMLVMIHKVYMSVSEKKR